MECTSNSAMPEPAMKINQSYRIVLKTQSATKAAKHIRLWLCLLAGLILYQVKPTHAQDSPISDIRPAPAGSEAKQDQESEKENESDPVGKKRQRRGSIVVAPVPIVSPAIGSGIVPVAAYIFPFQTKDKISAPSVIGAAGLITSNGSRGLGLATELFMKENRYKLKSVYVRGNVNYDLYGVGFAEGNAGLKLPLVQLARCFL
jgi:hypothetical protein